MWHTNCGDRTLDGAEARLFAEANDLLIEMRIELNNWKVNILGFRDEMRDKGVSNVEILTCAVRRWFFGSLKKVNFGR